VTLFQQLKFSFIAKFAGYSKITGVLMFRLSIDALNILIRIWHCQWGIFATHVKNIHGMHICTSFLRRFFYRC